MALTQWSHGSAIDPLLNHEEPVWALFFAYVRASDL